MNNFNLLKKMLLILIFMLLWVGAFAVVTSKLQVNFDENTLNLGSMSMPSKVRFSVQCISDKNGSPQKIKLECDNFHLSLSSQNNYKLIHNLNYRYSIGYLATIMTPGDLTENGKTYTSQINVKPAYFSESQRAGVYTDSLTLSIRAD